MKEKRRNKSHSTVRIVLPMLFAGILLMVLAFWACTGKERLEGDRSAEKTLEFLKLQCLRYDNMIATDNTEDQIQLLDKAAELSRCLVEKDDITDAEFLCMYAKEQRLAGVILTDNDFNVVADVCIDTDGIDDWSEVLEDEGVREVVSYTKKRYISHVSFEDGSIYNYVAIAMDDGRGMVLCYAHKLNNVMDDKQVRIENLLAGYRAEMDGIVIITDGDKVLSSNDDELIGIAVKDCQLISTDNKQISEDKITGMYVNGTEYLARMGKCKSYYLYVLFPAKSVYSQRHAVMAYMLVAYILVLLVLSIIKQQEATHTNRIKMEFLHQMSHDIRTPINGIRGMVRIGNSYPNDMEKQRECREKIWDASGLLLDLVNDVLDMGKLESGEMKPEEESFDLQELMQSVTAVMENQAKSQGITLSVGKLTGSNWRLIGSPVYVRRILVNIISNAIKYNCENGLVTVSCYELSRQSDKDGVIYEFVCADTGIGMSAEFQKHMFEQFTQEKTVGEVAHHGTGLGLAIVKSLVDELNGTIRCESEIGKGTVFYITIPFAIDAEQNALTSNDDIGKLASSNVICDGELEDKTLEGINILLVEDNEMNMEVAEFILTEEKATVVKAFNGKEAVDVFEKSKLNEIDVILMDVMMPVMDGEAATSCIRALKREDAATVPIIAMTANAFEEDIKSAFDAGMNEHITKPIEPDKLKRAVLFYVNQRVNNRK